MCVSKVVCRISNSRYLSSSEDEHFLPLQHVLNELQSLHESSGDMVKSTIQFNLTLSFFLLSSRNSTVCSTSVQAYIHHASNMKPLNVYTTAQRVGASQGVGLTLRSREPTETWNGFFM